VRLPAGRAELRDDFTRDADAFGSCTRRWCMSAQERGALRPIRLVFELARGEPPPVR
jgi:hypothetical protein